MNFSRLILVILSLIIIGCKGQTKKEAKVLKLNSFTFKSIFGTIDSSSGNVFCLLGTGFFKAPSSKNSDSLITTWMKGHPDAMVVPITSFGSAKSKITYCWIIQNGDTLNNYLIRNGCFPGGTMIRPRTWSEMGRKERKLYEGSKERSEINVFVDKTSYEIFLDQIRSAENYAQDKKLGIWAEGYKE